LVERLRLIAAGLIIVAAIVGCGSGEINSDGSKLSAPPEKSQSEIMKERGYSQEEINSRAQLPK
jgi:hypothetical protein